MIEGLLGELTFAGEKNSLQCILYGNKYGVLGSVICRVHVPERIINTVVEEIHFQPKENKLCAWQANGVSCENHTTKHRNMLCGQNTDFLLEQAVHVITTGL